MKIWKYLLILLVSNLVTLCITAYIVRDFNRLELQLFNANKNIRDTTEFKKFLTLISQHLEEKDPSLEEKIKKINDEYHISHADGDLRALTKKYFEVDIGN